MFKHASVPELEQSITRGTADGEAMQAWFAVEARRPPYPNAPGKDRLRVAGGGTVNGRPIIETPDGKLTFGQGLEGEKPFYSRNQNAIAPEKRRSGPTLISEEAVALGREKSPGKTRFPSDTIDNSHAEVAFLQNAHEAGLLKAGDTVTMPVVGEVVCKYCQDHLPLMAQKIGLRFITVIDKAAGKIYYWHPGLNKLNLLK